MNQLQTRAIVLTRTDFGEADRIVTFLTPDHGKIRVMARGVRKLKSKLAGGIELFSTSDITYIKGRGEIGTLVSTRLFKYYRHIVQDIDRVQLGYELIKLLNKATEDQPETEYFDLLEQAFSSLNDDRVSIDIIRPWFDAQLLRLSGHSPNLLTDAAGAKLSASTTYNFDSEAMCFISHPEGRYAANHIKILRLLFSHNSPLQLRQVADISDHITLLRPLIVIMLRSHTNV